MNRFLHRYARQSHEQHAAKTFCAIDDRDPGRVLGFDDQQDAACFLGYPETAQSRSSKQLPTKPLPRHADVRGDAREFEAGDFVPGQTPGHGRWHVVMVNG
jgi:hypothetical protein